MKTIYLAGGCFWGLQKFLDQFDGILSTEVGYANGPDAAPTYKDVCRDIGHAEAVKAVYDETILTLSELLGYYFMVIDPLSVNRQGNDRGIQYRTGIYYSDDEQLPEIEAVYREQEKKAGAELAVELEPIRNFFSAEEYHQKYLDKNPGSYCHIPGSFFRMGQKSSPVSLSEKRNSRNEAPNAGEQQDTAYGKGEGKEGNEGNAAVQKDRSIANMERNDFFTLLAEQMNM